MTDTVSACRAALLKACTIREYDVWRVNQEGGAWVSVDDAAVCMARAIEAAIPLMYGGASRAACLMELAEQRECIERALAAAQDKP